MKDPFSFLTFAVSKHFTAENVLFLIEVCRWRESHTQLSLDERREPLFEQAAQIYTSRITKLQRMFQSMSNGVSSPILTTCSHPLLRHVSDANSLLQRQFQFSNGTGFQTCTNVKLERASAIEKVLSAHQTHFFPSTPQASVCPLIRTQRFTLNLMSTARSQKTSTSTFSMLRKPASSIWS